jgi:hypothetical protein
MRVPVTHRGHFLRHLKIGGLLLLFLLGGALLVLVAKWPFTRDATILSLERVSSSEVQISSLRATFFPRPGYVAQNVTFTRDHTPGARPIARIRKITCRATWLALVTFTHRMNRMELEGVQIYIPAHIPPPIRSDPEEKIKTAVAELVANGTVLDIAPRDEHGQAVRFEFPELTLRNVGGNEAVGIRTLMRNPNPPGDLALTGTFGPLMPGRVADTRIAGTYQFRHADLSSYKIVAGELSAEGRFQGSLGRAEVVGTAKIPNFEVTRSNHSLGLSAEYNATVDGINGDVVLKSVRAHFLSTTLFARGFISGRHGKTVSLDFDGQQAEVQDLLRLFVTADRPPLDGRMTLSAHVLLPPTPLPFLQKVQLEGDFSIIRAEFTTAKTQAKVNELSARGRGRKNELRSHEGPERVTSHWQGNVRLRDAVATISAAFFAVPGAIARGSGTYDIATEAIDLRGKLAIQASLSTATTGVKSVLLIPVNRLFKKDGAGAVLGARIAGTYAHPLFKVSFTP